MSFRNLYIVWLFSTCPVFAQKGQQPKGLVAPLTWRDTLLLTVENGQKYANHLVKPGHTLFSISRFYGLGLKELFRFNPVLRDESSLQPGMLLKIPIPNRAIRRYKGTFFNPMHYAPIFYVVQPGDNLFHVAKRIFDMPTDSIRRRNRLVNDNVYPGQILHVGWISTEGIPADWRTSSSVELSKLYPLQTRFEEDKKRFTEHASQGICFWNRESNEKDDFYALHRKAIIGSVIAVTNPMNHTVVYAQVIGRIPSTYEPNIEVILSPAAARELRAIDPKFFVQTRYFEN
ncbi:MAG: LysM peptidoglycan-binding domain-containing protein [Saprospiraceae bacterium]|nr:LysM peptidoglycan-binding domain-containing protein [Saprospiraceae bacterium]MDW8483411.1 LysM peptidoglycan-binding domain-containing protein [Saprospiraceae bacterium]